MITSNTTSKKTTQTKEDSKESTTIYRRKTLSKLFEAYSKKWKKYSGVTTETFNRNFRLFLQRCDQSDILNRDSGGAFATMLTGTACQWHGLSVPEICNK